MSEETQALCFLAGANSIFIGNKLLTTGNPELSADEDLFAKLGFKPAKPATNSVKRSVEQCGQELGLHRNKCAVEVCDRDAW